MDTMRPILKSQYHATLAMLRDTIERCPRRTVDRRRLSQPFLADRLPRAVLHTFLPPAECGRLSSMGTSPDWNSIHG